MTGFATDLVNLKFDFTTSIGGHSFVWRAVFEGKGKDGRSSRVSELAMYMPEESLLCGNPDIMQVYTLVEKRV